ncbi:MAG TPA: hypothetical protein VH519_05505 [Hyphomicrobiaceae bacterium]
MKHPGWPAADELDQWVAALHPKLVVETERKFALALKGIMADAAVELLIDELEVACEG